MLKFLMSNRGSSELIENPFRPLVGCPSDYWIEVTDVDAARAAMDDYIIRHGLRPENWNGGQLKDVASDKPVGVISASGRFWPESGPAPSAKD